MSSQAQSNPQPQSTHSPRVGATSPPVPRRETPPRQQAFRETYLQRFPSTVIAEAFRLAGDALVDVLNEAGAWGPRSTLPLTYGEVLAACDDLDHLVGYLEEVADERIGSELDTVAEALSASATEWASRLAHLVLDIRRGLGEAEQAANLLGDTNLPGDC